jgi:hypothetical protein
MKDERAKERLRETTYQRGSGRAEEAPRGGDAPFSTVRAGRWRLGHARQSTVSLFY